MTVGGALFYALASGGQGVMRILGATGTLAQQFVASDTAKNHCQAFFASRLIGGEEKLVESLDRNQLSTQRREAHTREYISAVLVRCSKNLGDFMPPND